MPRPCSSVGIASFKRSREFGATLLADVGLIPERPSFLVLLGRGIEVWNNCR